MRSRWWGVEQAQAAAAPAEPLGAAVAAAACSPPAVAHPPFLHARPAPGRYMRFTQALQGGSLEEAEKLHSELLADLYTIQVGAALGAALDAVRRTPRLPRPSPAIARWPARPAPILLPDHAPPSTPPHTPACGQFQMANLPLSPSRLARPLVSPPPSSHPPSLQFQMAKLAAQGGAYERERAAHEQRQEQLQASIQQVRSMLLELRQLSGSPVTTAGGRALQPLLRCKK